LFGQAVLPKVVRSSLGRRQNVRTHGRSGGIDNKLGTISTGGGDVVGGNKITTTYYAPTEIHNAWQPVADAIRTAPPEKQAEAAAKLDDLKKEAAKGDKAEDTTIAKLVKGLVALVPSAVSAVVSSFGTPILSGVAGPVTKFVLDELGEGRK
jgi:hypothetical protein